MDQAGLQPTTGVLAAAPREEEDKIKASGSDGSVRPTSIYAVLQHVMFVFWYLTRLFGIFMWYR